jgi:F0F1-type ATP synthase epsilon subunit
LAKTFLAEVITPEKVLLRALAEDVTLKAEDGEITFLANHADYLAAVDITLAKIQVANATAVNEWVASYNTEYKSSKSPLIGVDPEDLHASDSLAVYVAVHGGFVHVTNGGVRLYSPVAELAAILDKDRAEAALRNISADTETSAALSSDNAGNPQLSPLLSTSQAARAILLPESHDSKKRRAEVRLAVLNAASGSFQ